MQSEYPRNPKMENRNQNLILEVQAPKPGNDRCETRLGRPKSCPSRSDHLVLGSRPAYKLKVYESRHLYLTNISPPSH